MKQKLADAALVFSLCGFAFACGAIYSILSNMVP